MQDKVRYIFPVVITAIIVFVVSGVVTSTNIGFRFDFLRHWLSAFIRRLAGGGSDRLHRDSARATCHDWLVVRIDGFA